MFYCEPCRVREGWPLTLGVKSDGPCEVCGNVAVCHDVQSALLSDPVRYLAVELALIDQGGQKVLEAIRGDRPADEVERLMAEFVTNKGQA